MVVYGYVGWYFFSNEIFIWEIASIQSFEKFSSFLCKSVLGKFHIFKFVDFCLPLQHQGFLLSIVLYALIEVSS